jgi:Flp pilus assembly protein TadD
MPYLWTILTSSAALLAVLWLSACAPGQGLPGLSSMPQLEMSQTAAQKSEAAHKSLADHDYKAAEAAYEALANENPGDAEFLVGLADSQRLQGKLDDAIKQYDKALDAFPGYPDALEGKGLILVQQAQFDAAVSLFSQVLKADPDRWHSLDGVGIAFAAKNLHEQAIQYYTKALAIEPTSPIVNNNIALSFAAQKQFKEAISALKIAIGGLSGDEEKRKKAELNLSLVYGLAGMMDPAEVILRKYLPEEKVYYNLGLYAKLARNYDLANTYLSKALLASPGVYENAWKALDSVKPYVSEE